MTNDITTIAGALQEVIDRLEDNLDAKGVTVSYDSSDGIVGLVDEILNINVGGNCLVTFENQGTEFNYTKKRGSNGFSVTVPNGVTSLGTECFSDCKGLKSITIPSTVTTLGENCFENCKSLTSFTIPPTLTTITQKAFQGSGLTSITIPPHITKIPYACFYMCDQLTNVTLPNTLTELGNQCFYYCTKLTSISIPASVTSLNMSFRGCSKLVDYQLYWDDPPITWTNNHMPNNTNTYYTIPAGSTSNYVAKSFPSNKLIERS